MMDHLFGNARSVRSTRARRRASGAFDLPHDARRSRMANRPLCRGAGPRASVDTHRPARAASIDAAGLQREGPGCRRPCASGWLTPYFPRSFAALGCRVACRPVATDFAATSR